MFLTEGFQAVAGKLQEAAQDLSHDNIRARLSDELRDQQDEGQYGYIVDIFGDSSSGDVVYCCNGDLKRAQYTIEDGAGGTAAKCMIDTENAVDVVPRTTYEQEVDDEDHYTAMEEAHFYADNGPGTGAPMYERFISKGERKAADAGSFAGKGKSFPILKPGDVMAAVRSMGRAGSANHPAATLKANIMRIARRKGWAKYLPKSWQGKEEGYDEAHRGASGTAGVSRAVPQQQSTALVESAYFPDRLPLSESDAEATHFTAKLIAPGRGSSGYYTPEVLKRDGPKVFTAGTHMYINHATDAEEAARPEGDLSKLASVLASNAYYDESGKAGPGLYAPIKVFSDFAGQIKEKAKHSGVSIRARGQVDTKNKAPDGKMGLVTAIESAQSVDHVTKPGAGGQVLTEAATAAGEKEMDKSEVQALIKESMAPVLQDNQRLRQELAQAQAPAMILEALREIRLPEQAKRRIIEKLAYSVPMNEAGIDRAKLTEAIEAQAKVEAQYLAELGIGDGVATRGVRMTEAELKTETDTGTKHFEEAMGNLTDIFVGKKLVRGLPEQIALRDEGREAFQKGRAA